VTYDIDKEFADLDSRYPGSKKTRREATASVEEPAWDAKPIIKKLGGVDTEFFLLGALANALGKSPVTIRLWERKAYIPKSPYRLPSAARAGKTVPGKRVFTRGLIDIAVQEFHKRGLLGAARVEWNQHDDLTIAIFERWTALTDTAN
jgi:hypothetical protein